jgi:hypothetical protein
MNTRSTSLMFAALLACVAHLASEPVFAADEHSSHQPGTAAAPAAPGNHGMPDRQKLREQMAAIRAATDPAVRAKLMEEHLQAMEAAMQTMQQDKGCMMMRGGHTGQ